MNFKFKFVFSLILFSSIFISSQTKNFSISGKILDTNINNIIATYTNEKNLPVTKNIKVSNEVFFFQGGLKDYSPVSLNYENKVVNLIVNSGNTNLTIKNGLIISISGKGSKTENDKLISKDYLAIRNLENRILPLQQKYLKIYKSDSIQSIKIAQEGQKLQEYILIKYQSFVKNNPNSFQSIEYLRVLNSQIDFGKYENLFTSLSDKVKNSFLGKKINEEITNKKNSSVGEFIADFSIKDMNNKPINLSAFRAKKNVLLVFWASWCAPCIEEIKIFKEKYSNFKSTEIILISALDKDKMWLNAVEKYDLKKFINIFDVETPNNLYTKYAIPLLPTSILINKKGKIVGRYEGLQTSRILKDIDKINLTK